MGGFMRGGSAAKKAGEASITASETQADYQREALEYLKETEALPQEFREGALKMLAGAYGLEGGEGSQQQLIDQARASPLYEAITGGRQAGEEAILRNQAMTGGLRSGGTQEALYDYNTQLENTALLEAYNQQMQGLGGLAQLPSLAPQIARGTSDIGQTLAMGQIGAAQSQAQGSQAGFGNLMGLGNLGLSAYQVFSDRRLKKDIHFIGERNGLKFHTWTWNHKAHELGLFGWDFGVIVDEVETDYPDVIGEKQGYKTVNFPLLLDQARQRHGVSILR